MVVQVVLVTPLASMEVMQRVVVVCATALMERAKGDDERYCQSFHVLASF
jgi:hypothetical protein